MIKAMTFIFPRHLGHTKGLDAGDDPRNNLSPRDGSEVVEEGLDGRLAEGARKPPLGLEENTQHLGDDKDNLAVRDIQKHCLPHPFERLAKSSITVMSKLISLFLNRNFFFSKNCPWHLPNSS